MNTSINNITNEYSTASIDYKIITIVIVSKIQGGQLVLLRYLLLIRVSVNKICLGIFVKLMSSLIQSLTFQGKQFSIWQNIVYLNEKK